jgi:hypothetical protein
VDKEEERKKMRKLSAWAAHRAGNLRLPPGYRLERDADLLELPKTDGSLVAAFSVRGASPAAVVREAEEDHRRHGRSTA